MQLREDIPNEWSERSVPGMYRALKILARHPGRTDLVGEFLSSSGSNGYRDLYLELMEDPDTRALLHSGRDLLVTLRDREHLSRLPRGTLGREYFEWTEAHEVDADGLADTIDVVERHLTTPVHVLSARMVDMHDLWHVLNGWDNDMFGEMHLLGFSYAQLRTPGWLYLGLAFCFALSSGGRHEGLYYFARSFMIGKRARRLLGLEWESMLERPLLDLRRELRLPEPRPYRKMSITEWRTFFARSWIARSDRWIRTRLAARWL